MGHLVAIRNLFETPGAFLAARAAAKKRGSENSCVTVTFCHFLAHRRPKKGPFLRLVAVCKAMESKPHVGLSGGS